MNNGVRSGAASCWDSFQSVNDAYFKVDLLIQVLIQDHSKESSNMVNYLHANGIELSNEFHV